jgi:predicted ATPase/DNA-binding XRE family transcriptional regulator
VTETREQALHQVRASLAQEQPTAFGAILKRHRTERALTQEELAERAGLSVRAISDLERGIRRVPYRDTVRQLADALELPDADRRALEAASGRVGRNVRRFEGFAPSTLPDERTSFIGREQEIAALAARVRWATGRLVTLTGTGGIGKTRLAIEVARVLSTEFPDGVCFVSLAPVSSPDLVPSSIAAVLGVQERGRRSLLERVKEHVRERALLLILDNFEHVLNARMVVAELLDACPHLRILVTSRAVLHLAREHLFEVPPLSLPTVWHTLDMEALERSEATALFIERTQAARADFVVEDEDALTIAEICWRLEGLPLAIELAAARIRLFSPSALLGRLNARLDLLVGGARDAPARQQTLRDTIDWSYGLLTPDQQRLLANLSVFKSGWTPEAAQAVAAEDLPAGNVLDAIGSLVDQSLVQPVVGGKEPRFTMLETVREYAAERLESSGARDVVRVRHAAYFRTLAEEGEPHLVGPDQGVWLDRLEAELDNLRAALDYARNQREGETALRLATATYVFWDKRGYWAEWLARLDAALSIRTPCSPQTRAKALYQSGMLIRMLGDPARAEERLAESLALAHSLNDVELVVYCSFDLGWVRWDQEDYAAARERFEQTLAVSRAANCTRGTGLGFHGLGMAALQAKEYGLARQYLQEAVAVFRAMGDLWEMAEALNTLGDVARVEGDYRSAEKSYQEALGVLTDVGVRSSQSSVNHNLGHVALRRGDIDAARAYFRDALQGFARLGDRRGMVECLVGLAGVWARARPERAARLLGAADAQFSAMRAQLFPSNRPDYEYCLTDVRERMEPKEFARARAEGRGLTLGRAITEAFDDACRRGGCSIQ